LIEIDEPPVRMRLREIEPGADLGMRRGDCVVCIPLYGGHRLFVECLHSVLRHTPESALVLVADDASPDDGGLRLLRELDASGELGRDVVYIRQPANRGFVGNVNSAMAMADPADVVVLNSDCMVAEGWLDGLREAVYSDTTLATASALTNNGTILSVPFRNRPAPQLPQEWTLDQAALAVRRASPRLRPRIPTAIGHCMYIRRTALDLVGDLDEAFAPGYGEEVDFSQRCLARGLSHVAADDVLVWHHGGGSFGPAARRFQEEHDRIVESRYPSYAPSVDAAATDRYGPLARTLGAARRALLGLSVTVDATCLGSTASLQGTQLHALELIHALWRHGDASLRVVVHRTCHDVYKRFLAGLDGVRVLFVDEVTSATDPSDVVHRPYQVGYIHELVALRRLGERLVLTQQDLIAYRNPAYFPAFQEWERYSQAVRASLALADAVLFFSRHAAADAVGDGLVAGDRAHVVAIGTDHHFPGREAPRAPRGSEALEAGGPFLLCLGADFLHKNRVFALRLLDQLQERHRWPGRLVLVGARVACGSSSSEEAGFLLRHPSVERATVRMGAVTEGEKDWLMARASCLLYPTVYEGFGLVPFEAAAAQVPCAFAPQASLAEVLPAECALIVPWDAAATADRLIGLLDDEGARSRLVAAVAAVGQKYRWDTTAAEAVRVYRDALEGPPSWRLSPDLVDPEMTLLGRHLVGAEGVLSEGVQHLLWAIGRRGSLARPFFATMTGIHGLGRAAVQARARLRRSDRAPRR
jgi:glycosyltransferase involved in cell wall biosynthesis/GT2 family glycosyltransferase